MQTTIRLKLKPGRKRVVQIFLHMTEEQYRSRDFKTVEDIVVFGHYVLSAKEAFGNITISMNKQTKVDFADCLDWKIVLRKEDGELINTGLVADASILKHVTIVTDSLPPVDMNWSTVTSLN